MDASAVTATTSRWRRVGPALCALVAVAGCSDVRRAAEQPFEPAAADYLTVATTLPAPGFWDAPSEPATPTTVDRGFEWAIADALARRLGLELRIVVVPFDRIVAGDLGGADLALAQVSITESRAEAVDFSTPYFDTSAAVLARSGESMTDLKTARERSWCIVSSTTEADFVNGVIRPDDVLERQDDLACAQAVRNGEVDASLLDLPSALVLQQRVDGLDTVARFGTDEHYGAVLPKGSPNVEQIDAALRELDSNGSLRSFAESWLSTITGRDPLDIPVIEART
jgi:polar amino acid transport system substrate-binding protein